MPRLWVRWSNLEHHRFKKLCQSTLEVEERKGAPVAAWLPGRGHSAVFTWPSAYSDAPVHLPSYVQRLGQGKSWGWGGEMKLTLNSAASGCQHNIPALQAGAAQGSKSRWQAGSISCRSPRPCSRPFLGSSHTSLLSSFPGWIENHLTSRLSADY